MKRFSGVAPWVLGCGLLLAACSRSGVEPGAGTFGANGGTFADPRGLKLIIPPGALDRQVTLGADVIDAPAALPGRPVSLCWHLMPDGLLFLRPATLILEAQPSGPAAIVTAEGVAGPFELLSTQLDAGELIAPVEHFSIFAGVEPDGGGLDGGDAGAGPPDDGGADAGDAGGSFDAGDDGGGLDAGDDGGAFDAGITCDPLVWDGGAPACSGPAADAGRCSSWRPWITGFGYGASQTCEAGGGQDLTCIYGTCTCSSPFAQVTFPMPDTTVTCLDQVTQLWTCQCGFPPQGIDPPICSAPVGGSDGGLFSLPTGANCTTGTDCQYGICLNTIYGHICSADCVDSVCPCSFHCQQVYPSVLSMVCMP